MSTIEKGTSPDWYDDGYRDGYEDSFKEHSGRIAELKAIAEAACDAYEDNRRWHALGEALRAAGYEL